MHPILPLTLGNIILDNAKHFPECTAFVFEQRHISHGQFADRTNRLASAMEKRGLKRQDRIAILSMNRIEFAEVYGAGELAGFITATVNWRLAPPEIEWIIKDASPRILVFEAQYREVIEKLLPQLAGIERYICIDAAPEWAEGYEAVVQSGDAAGPSFCSRPEDIAYLIYTSGTTGRPKGCILGQAEMLYQSQQLGAEIGILQTDCVLTVMPLFHIGAKVMQLVPHWRGGTVVLKRQFDASQVPLTIATEKITVLLLAPTMFQMLIESPAITRHDLTSLKTILYAAAPMPSQVLRRGMELLGEIFVQQWGQTEGSGTTLHRHQHRPNGSARDLQRLASVGQPNRGVQIRIVDDAGNECPTGVPGEVLYRTGGMFRGYWNNSPATLATLVDGWCHSGDIGKLDEEGFLYLVDRKKDMIISGGENIYCREVEEAILQHPAVSEVAVIGLADPKWGQSVCAVVVLRPGASVSADALVNHCKPLIASYKKPKTVIFTANLPKLPNGKVSKLELRRQHDSGNC